MPINRCFVATVEALYHAIFRLERVAGSSFIILMAEVAFHIAMLAAFSAIGVDGETIVTDQHIGWFLELQKLPATPSRPPGRFCSKVLIAVGEIEVVFVAHREYGGAG